MKKAFSALLLCVSLLVAVPALADTTVGLPADLGGGNCFPFGCAYNAEYQQVYTYSAFSGPITITDLEFFNTQVDNNATAMSSGTWTISLSTTSADLNTLSGTYASNLGADNTQVFSGNLSQPWAFGDTLTINLTTPFTYTPASGANLLMDVVGSGVSAPGGNIFFDVNRGNVTSRVFCYSGISCAPGNVDSGYGLVTDFTTGVPEPSTILLLGSGLVGLLGAARRRLRK